MASPKTTLKTPAEKRAARKAAARRTDAPSSTTEAATPATLPKGKLGVLVALLSRPDGATIADLADATGWQDHSVRGALAGALKKRGLVVTSEKIDRVRVYRLPKTEEGA